ncbi:Tubulin-tyrosine ligase family [Novymonas esmeraldas]|uniref:Tubulin-tyrosine ligase family n=1 Tax=Novymonas esmeraldas TaxID=1808958 RepID=A0AAW0EX25_9TRYP
MHHGDESAHPTASATPAAASSDSVVVDCHRTRYHVVRAAVRLIGWVVDDTDTQETVPATFHGVSLVSHTCAAPAPHAAQVLWVDKSVVRSTVAGLACHQRLNHFAAMNVIARKAQLFRRLMQLSRLHAEADDTRRRRGSSSSSCADLIDGLTTAAAAVSSSLKHFFDVSVPPSYSSITELGRLAAFQREWVASQPPYFIIKPNTGCEGRGIRITATPEADLSEAERADRKSECVVQLYVDRPLLMGGRKFDLRLYVLLLSVVPQPPQSRSRRAAAAAADDDVGGARAVEDVPRDVRGVELYVHREGLVRLCVEPYAPPTEVNCRDARRHLSNYAVNRDSALYVPPNHDDGDAAAPQAVAVEGSKRSLAALAAFIDSLGTAGGWPRVRRSIDECIALTILSGVEVLRRELIGAGGARGYRADGRGCFELLGFDVMLREADLRPVLMEVNHSPSLFCDTAFDFSVKSTVLADTLRLVATRMPPWAHHEGDPQRYAARMAGAATAQWGQHAEAPFGFRAVLPHYAPGDGAGGAAAQDWHPEERAAQQRLVELSKRLP